MNEWMGGCTGIWMNIWMDGWMEKIISVGQFFTRNSFKNKISCYAIAICGQNLAS